MDLIEGLKKRRSIREYKDLSIPDSVIEEIIEIAKFAPTARNLQPWKIVVVKDKKTKKKISELAIKNAPFIDSAPVLLCVFCEDTKYYLEDGSSLTTYILLAAFSKGIGSCWIAGDKKPYCEDIKRLLKVPSKYKLVSMVSLGYPAQGFEKTINKKELSEILSWEVFKE